MYLRDKVVRALLFGSNAQGGSDDPYGKSGRKMEGWIVGSANQLV